MIAPPAAIPAPDSAAATEFILGNTVFVLAHEFGHAIIHDFNVPILGVEENSADTIAAGVLILAERLFDGARVRVRAWEEANVQPQEPADRTRLAPGTTRSGPR